MRLWMPAALLSVCLRNQAVGRVVLPQNLAAGGELDAGDIPVPVILIPGAGKQAPAPLLVRAQLHLNQPARRVIAVVQPLGQALAEQARLPGAPVQAVILIAHHSPQAVAHPHQSVLPSHSKRSVWTPPLAFSAY